MRLIGLVVLAACSTSTGERTGTDLTDSVAPESPAEATEAPGEEAPIERADASLPVFGGTLHIAEDGHTALVGDVQGDRLFVVDTATRDVLHTVTFADGAVPFRIDDADGTAYVSLRGTGEVAAIDLASGQVADTWHGCLEPRGVAVDGSDLQLVCASGELVTFDRATGARRSVQIDKDLRDVVVEGDHLWISRLRSAEVLQVARTGEILHREAPPVMQFTRGNDREQSPFGSTVGWAMSEHPAGGVVLVHQRVFLPPVIIGDDDQGGYGDPVVPTCGGILGTSLTRFEVGHAPQISRMLHAPLAVDGEVQPDGSVMLALAAADSGSDIMRVPASAFDGGATDRCFADGHATLFHTARASSVRVDGSGRTVALGRAPLTLRVDGALVDLGVKADLPHGGFDLFHADAGLGISCAGCHPEANDDGHTWNFEPIGPRRTQNVAVGLAGTEPFHWDGDMDDMEHLMLDVFVGRMGGDEAAVDASRADGLLAWMDAQAPHRVETAATSDEVSRGADLYWSAAVGCGDCHNGPSLTDNLNHRVREGDGRLQTPSLVGIAGRGPYMHDGCAETLRDRFGDCGGGDRHGRTSHLSEGDIDALVAYLETL